MPEFNSLGLPQWLQLAAAALALYYGAFWLTRGESNARTALKTLPVVLLALSALAAGTQPLLAAALAASAAGDAFLAREGERPFIFGLAAFLLAHLFYATLFAGMASPGAYADRDTLLAALIVAALVGMVLLRLWPWLGSLHLPVIAYAAAIGVMAFTGFAARPGTLVMAGIVLFLLSDIILALDRFTPLTTSPFRRLAPHAIWAFYFGGQAMIAYGLLHA